MKFSTVKKTGVLAYIPFHDYQMQPIIILILNLIATLLLYFKYIGFFSGQMFSLYKLFGKMLKRQYTINRIGMNRSIAYQSIFIFFYTLFGWHRQSHCAYACTFK